MSTDGERPRSERPESTSGDKPSQGDPTVYREPPAPEPIQLPDFDKSDEPSKADQSSTADESNKADEPSTTDEPGEAPKRTGRISYQDENTAPREPTLAEQRARQQADKRALEEEEERWAEEARQAKKRKRMLIGGAVGVGLVAVVAIGYAASRDDEDSVEARCVDPNNVVVDDSNCVQPAASGTQQQYHSGGFGFIPIFIGGGGQQYHYNYGGSGSPGQVATGGTTAPPKNATVRTPSGKTVAGSSSVSRGGFGVNNSGGSSSGSGKSGGS